MRIILLGHISFDIRDGNTLLGGPVSYQYPVMKLHTNDISIITSFIPDSLDTDSIFKGAIINNLESKKNTIFEFDTVINEQNNDDRTLYLKSKANKLEINYLKKVCKPKYDLLIVSPIINEFGIEEIRFLATISTINVVDMQGLVRQVVENGKVVNDLDINLFNMILNLYDIIKISKSELGNYYPPTNLHNSLLLVTDGGNSVEIYQNGEVRRYLVHKQENVVDATGSGDIFLAVFSSFVNTLGEVEAIKMAHEITKSNLNNNGIPKYEDINETYQKMSAT